MVVYHRIGNTGEQHLADNASSTSFLHQLRNLWESPKGTVLRIEALALAAILLSFFLAAFGTCRRWSNRWIIQKGFVAANAMFLSLGTYSIGLMQSSQVRSEMYPIWAVSLLALLTCVDSASMTGIGNESQIWKLLYQLCLYFGYVVLMSVSTISSDIGNIAICLLSAVTLIMGFHRSMAAFVLPSSMRNAIRDVPAYITDTKCFEAGEPDEKSELPVDMTLDVMVEDGVGHKVSMGDIASMIMRFRDSAMKIESDLHACKDVCLSLSLSHLLQRRLLGWSSSRSGKQTRTTITSTEPLLVQSYERALKVVEIELAFVYDVLYTSNAFLHYHEARSCSIWAVASVLGICFVGAVAVVPGARTTPPGTIAVHTTVADSVITGVILVSLSLLQVLQLLRCWTSNWAGVAFACDLFRKYIVRERPRLWMDPIYRVTRTDLSWGIRLRASLLKINWFDDKYYLWQKKIRQHSLMESIRLPGSRLHLLFLGLGSPRKCLVVRKCWALFGLRYMGRVLQELLRVSNTEGALHLHPDVTQSIGDFVEKIRSNDVSSWASSMLENKGSSGQTGGFPEFRLWSGPFEADDDIYVPCILMWHIATCYCQLVQEQREQEQEAAVAVAVQKDRRVATALSKYCAYLVVSAPRLLPGRTDITAKVYATARDTARNAVKRSSSSSSAADREFSSSFLLPCINSQLWWRIEFSSSFLLPCINSQLWWRIEFSSS